MVCTIPLSSSNFQTIPPSPLNWITPPKPFTIFPFTSVIFPTKWLDMLDMVVEVWLSMPIVKESESTQNSWGLQQMLDNLSGDREGKDVHITLGCCIHLGHLFPIQAVCPLLSGLRYLLQLRLWLYFCFLWGLCRPEVSLRYVSNSILDFVHYEIVMIDLIPLFRHLYFLQVLLDTSDTAITVMVAPIMMMMILRASAVRNAGSRWALAIMRLSVKTPSPRQCPTLPVGFH